MPAQSVSQVDAPSPPPVPNIVGATRHLAGHVLEFSIALAVYVATLFAEEASLTERSVVLTQSANLSIAAGVLAELGIATAPR